MKTVMAGVVALSLGLAVQAQDNGGKKGGRGDAQAAGKEGRGPKHQPPPFPESPALNVVLGRPTDQSVVLSVWSSQQDRKVVVEYGVVGSPELRRSAEVALLAGQPGEVRLAGLRRDTAYQYRVLSAGEALAQGTFHTQRGLASDYCFTVTADTHLDQNTSTDLYARMLAGIKADRPDFHIDLGDTFMTEKYDDRNQAYPQYLAQRHFFGLMADSVPLYLVLGNHDGESVRQWNEGSNGLGQWSYAMRTKYFPNPIADAFYSGGDQVDGQWRQDYFAWQWGDALYVALNPYSYGANGKRAPERWGLSLGQPQYEWLRKTLEGSTAKYKFIFIHQLVGGINSQGRGGVEGVEFGEWGGKNADGSEGFASQRPGWAEPIHTLLVKHKVTAVFHGHDHVFAQQERDGVTYQAVPQPGRAGFPNAMNAVMGGYQEGTIMGDSGYLQVCVDPQRVQVDLRSVAVFASKRAEAAYLTAAKSLYSYTLPVKRAHPF